MLPFDLLLGIRKEDFEEITFYIYDKKEYSTVTIDFDNLSEYTKAIDDMIFIDFKSMLGDSGVIYMIERDNYFMYLKTSAKYKHTQHHRLELLKKYRHSLVDMYLKLDM
jgi:Ni,Fe-hydrogenase maturation factor